MANNVEERFARFYDLMGQEPPPLLDVNTPLDVKQESTESPCIPGNISRTTSTKNIDDQSTLGHDSLSASEAWDKLTPIERFLQNIPNPNAKQSSDSPLPPAQAGPKPRAAHKSIDDRPNEHQPIHEVKVPAGTVSNESFQLDSRMGEVAAPGNFVPFLAVTKYCYRFAPRDYVQPLATAFWDNNKIWNREWDLFYIYSPTYGPSEPVVFIKEAHFQALLEECNSAFPGAKLAISQEHRQEGLVLTFDAPESELRPHFLGHSDSRARHDFLLGEIPEPENMEGLVNPSDRSLEAFKHNMELAREVNKNKNKAKKSKSKIDKDAMKRSAVDQVLLTERYLGLLARTDQDASSIPDIGKLNLTGIDIEKLAPHPFDHDVVMISIDVEAYEHNSNIITEVGIATLDTRDLADAAPGRVGENWQKQIRGRHFRVIEYKDMINSEFVQGCPDRFDFGKSEFVGKDRLASACTSCFHEPFSKRLEDGSFAPGGLTQDVPRNIVLVGHDINADLAFCNKIGFQPLNRGNLLGVLDTATLYRAYSRNPSPRNLGSILYDFDLTGWNLHNAGNDAVYTLWALIAVAVSDASERGTDKATERVKMETEQRTAAAEQAAREKIAEDVDGWVTEGDGGMPVRPKASDFERKGPGKRTGGKPTFGPERPPEIPEGHNGLWTAGGVPLDV